MTVMTDILTFGRYHSEVNMSLGARKKYFIGACLGFGAVFLLWLVKDETSPLVKYFEPNSVPFAELWTGIHFPIFLLMLAFRIPDNEGHWFFYTAVFIQWFLIGLVAVWLRSRK